MKHKAVIGRSVIVLNIAEPRGIPLEFSTKRRVVISHRTSNRSHRELLRESNGSLPVALVPSSSERVQL